MSDIDADSRGLIRACPKCGQRNRLPYERLGSPPRCAKCGEAIPAPDQPVAIESDEDFAALTARSALPVLVDFWAAWCGPCKMIAPEVAKVAQLGGGRWVVAKVDTESLPATAQRFSVRSIPLLVLLVDGRERARQAGALPAEAIRQFLEQNL